MELDIRYTYYSIASTAGYLLKIGNLGYLCLAWKKSGPRELLILPKVA